MRGGEEIVNIGALQSMIGINQTSASSAQRVSHENPKFGAIFSGISSKPIEGNSPKDVEVSADLIPNIFNASNVDELIEAIQLFQGEFTFVNDSSMNGSMEEFAQGLSLNTEEILKSLKKLLEKAGMTKAETEELTAATDMWTLLNIIDEAGIRFFENLNEALEKPVTRNEATQLLSFIKSLELIAPKNDMLISMEQKVDSFRHMLESAASQFDQRMIAVGKQEQLPFTHQKADFRIVLESNSSTSSNTEGSGQKQAYCRRPIYIEVSHLYWRPIRQFLIFPLLHPYIRLFFQSIN